MGIIGLLSEFLCMETENGEPCTTAISEAILNSGYSGAMTGKLDVSGGLPNVTEVSALGF